jgi:hypothetical protein
MIRHLLNKILRRANRRATDDCPPWVLARSSGGMVDPAFWPGSGTCFVTRLVEARLWSIPMQRRRLR